MKQTGLFVLLLAIFAATPTDGFAQDKKAEKKKKTAEVTFVVNMFCDNCKAKIERHLSWEKGVKDLSVNLNRKQVYIRYDPSKTSEAALQKVIESLEYTCEKVPDETATGQ
ncbi:MAG: heavy-metal-associated domain-containing protein [Tannerella sp.]|jgi:copper chaperone CopZ|nr:heavy-metal-associated domain-containing protein [Tannerella sp.]